MKAAHKIHTAKLTVARAQVEIAAISLKLKKTTPTVDDLLADAGIEGPIEEQIRLDAEFEIRQRDLTKLLETYASDPDLRAEMVPWMVDFEGEEQPTWFNEMRHPSNSEADLTAKSDFGELPKLVRAWIEDNGFKIIDSGGGCGGWHLGVPCSDMTAAKLCSLAQIDWRDHLEANMLTMRLKFWGWRFDGVYNWNEAEEFVRRFSAS